MSLNPNTCVFNSLYKNLLNSFYERTFVSKYHFSKSDKSVLIKLIYLITSIKSPVIVIVIVIVIVVVAITTGAFHRHCARVLCEIF